MKAGAKITPTQWFSHSNGIGLKEKLCKAQPRKEGHFSSITIMHFYNAQLLFNTLVV